MEPERLKLLYVDDDHNDLALFGIAVDKLDLNLWLFTATSGQQAIEHLTSAGNAARQDLQPLPDVIVLDLRMHQTSGFEFLSWRRESAFRAIPVVGFTASADANDQKKALGLGADLCLPKPAGFTELKRTVRQIYEFGASRLRKQSALAQDLKI